MQERMRLVNGSFTVKPDPGHGTLVRVLIPFESPSARILSRQINEGGHSRTFSVGIEKKHPRHKFNLH
jgi:hypothetical protein